MLEPLLVQISWWANTFEQEVPEYWSAALRSAGAPERSRFAGARSERHSGKLARSAVGAPLRKRPERTWSTSTPTVKFIRYTLKISH